MKKYSIILPIRNGGEYVKKCVRSILSQTFEDFNLIILENCSTDGTAEWLGSLKDQRIIIDPSPVPLTIEENWGRIPDFPKGEFMTIIGHDDILYPDFLKTIDELISQNFSASLFLTHFDLINMSGEIIRPCKPMPSCFSGSELLKAILTKTVDLMGTGYVMRSKDYNALGGIPVNYPSLLYADFELWINLANISFEAVSPSYCFAFRMHSSTAHSSKDSKMHIAMEQFFNYLSNLKLSDKKMGKVIDENSSDFLLFYCKSFAHRILRTRINDRERLTVEKIIQMTKTWATKIGIADNYHPEKSPSIRIAKIIDRNILLRKLFYSYRKSFPKSIGKK